MFCPACYAPVRCRKLGAEVRFFRPLQLGVVPRGGGVPLLDSKHSVSLNVLADLLTCY